MNRPLWLLDVDGVINAVTSYPKMSVWKYRRVKAGGYPIWYSPEVVDFVNSTSELVDVAWLTTWGELARSELAPKVGLKDFPVWGVEEPTRQWWKLEQAAKAEEGRALIWSDDDLRFQSQAREWARARGNTLAVVPEERVGLTGKDLERIWAFLHSTGALSR